VVVDTHCARTLRGVVDHIDHIVELVGPDHVGLGSDYDGIPYTPKGLEDVTMMPDITRELVKRGYGEEDIVKILGGNHLRLIKEITR
jgi:membrane dipeptidase